LSRRCRLSAAAIVDQVTELVLRGVVRIETPR
jgi:hypothetical protein